MAHIRRIIGLMTLLALVLSGCTVAGFGPQGVAGSGNVVDEQRNVSDFDAVDLSGIGELVIEQGSEYSLTISADDNLLPLLTSDVRGSTLQLGVRDGSTIRDVTRIRYELTLPELKAVTISGAGSAEISKLEAERLSITLSGVGGMQASGSVDTLNVGISGAGGFDGAELQAREATVRLSGTGSAVVAVSDSLDATVSGMGSIEYIGDPEVRADVSGMGEVRER